MHLNPTFEPVEGADGWQLSNPPILAMTPLLAALEGFDAAGMPALREKSEKLTGYLEFLLRKMPPGALEFVTPADPSARGCQLSLRLPGSAADATEALRKRGIVADFRPPDAVRVAPVPSYNTFHEVWRFAQALDEILQGR
jgi:kynureninase